MTDKDNLIRRRLEALKQECLELSDAAKDNRKPVKLDQQSVGRLSRMDSLQVHAMDQAQEQARRKRIVRIDAALERLDNGDYGFCVTCDEPIGEKRLDVDPATPLCVKCAR